MRYFWLVLSYTVALVSSQENRVGDLYLAEEPYTDWLSTDACAAFKGKPCNMKHCIGSRYANDVCCCDVQLDRIAPEKPVYIIADVPVHANLSSVQLSAPPIIQQPVSATEVQLPADVSSLQVIVNKIKNCLGLGT